MAFKTLNSLEIIFEDDYCILVNKPNNVLVHHAHHSRNVRDEASLLDLIKHDTHQTFYPVHRLDRKTSGVILLSKKKQYVSEFQELFTNQEIKKIYYGLVRGFAPQSVDIDSPVKGRDAKVYKEAQTALRSLDNITLNIPVKPYDTSRYSLVELKPRTGRMHQLRIHMQKISHPLIGDPKYGDNNHNIMFESNFGITNLFLHAGRLSFIHPFTSEKINAKAQFPEHWQFVFHKFNWNNPFIVQ